MKRLLPLLFSVVCYFGSVAQVVKKLSDYSVGNTVTFAVNNRVVVAKDSKFFVGDGKSPLTEVTGGPKNLSFPVAFNNRLYFSSDNVIYKTDGTDTGTHVVSNTKSLLGDFTLCNGQIFYETEDYNITKINLTSLQSAVLYNDGLPSFNNIMAVGNEVYFTANSSINGGGLWKSDGTAGGTVQVKSIPSTNANYYISYGLYLYASFGNKLVFGFKDYGSQKADLWVSDGTTAGTQKIENASTFYGAVLGDKYYYAKSSPTSANFSSLWVTNGTLAGSHMVRDSIFIEPNQSVMLNGKIICILNNDPGTSGMANPQLAILDSNTDSIIPFASFDLSNVFPVKLFSEGLARSSEKNVFFIAYDSAHGAELWITDGTAANTSMVKDILPGTSSSFDRLHSGNMPGITHNEFASYYYTSSGIYFAANDSIHGMELWQSDGTEAGTKLVKDINPAADDYVSGPEDFFVTENNLVFFHAVYNSDVVAPYPSGLYVIGADSAALPVTLASFTAAPAKQDVQVNWATFTEINTSYFTLQRSSDGRQFADVATAQAAGNSQVKRQYSYIDAGALNTAANTLYYRLQTNDKDGKQYYSAIVPVKVNAGITANVYPNPAADYIVINYNLPISSKATLRITDAGGKQVMVKQLSNSASGQTSVNVKALTAGVYYIQVITGEGVQTTRFVKQ